MSRAHRLPLQVRFGDTDALGHVNNAAFATYGESARLAFFASLAGAPAPAAPVPSSAPIDPSNPDLGIILAHLSIDFRRQVRFGQTVHVDTVVDTVGHSSITLRQQVVAQDQVAADMRAILVVFDYRAQESRPVPPALRALLLAQRSA